LALEGLKALERDRSDGGRYHPDRRVQQDEPERSFDERPSFSYHARARGPPAAA